MIINPMFRIFSRATLISFTLGITAHAFNEIKPKDDAEYIKNSALKIDTLIANFYRLKKLPVPEVTDDAMFMRRSFLATIGRIPTAEEAWSFIEMEDADKRAELVDYLIKSRGYSSHMTNWAFDLLRLRDFIQGGQGNGEPYRNWIREAMDQNMPWNQFVDQLISSTGNGWDPKTAAVGYYTSDRGMPLDNLSNTMRVFLGTRMECAQCHDDPFGETERKDFYHLAAFTHGQEQLNKSLMSNLWRELQANRESRGIEYQVGQLFWDTIYGMSLDGGGDGRITLPSDYQYRDGKPGDILGGKTPFGKSVRTSDRNDDDKSRKKLSEWITEKTGPQFASVIADRMWKRVMGKGIHEPVDEYVEASKTVYPELMTYLSTLMVELDYDLRAFQKVLLLTKTFQFATNPNPSTIAGGDDFHGRKIERLSAEQIWDSLITLSNGDPDKLPSRTVDHRIYVGGRPVLVGEMDMVQLSSEVLALKTEESVRKYYKDFLDRVKKGSVAKKSDSSMMMTENVQKYGVDSAVRASDLPSPAPREHFLYLFGASDREVVESASKDPNVGQMLSLMNGFVQRQLVNKPDAHVYKSLQNVTSTHEKIRRLYLAILSRPPTTQEMEWMLAEVESAGDQAYRNIVGALVMSSEFVFLQ
jgi:hypothetical protein